MSGARTYALNLLKRRFRSAWEIDQALMRRGVEQAERAAILEELTEHNLINDERFALAWVHTRDRLAPRGQFLLERELSDKGIDKATIRLVMMKRKEEMAEAPELNPDEDSQIQELIRRKERLYANLAPEVRKRRLMGYLARRGFSPDRVRRILDA